MGYRMNQNPNGADDHQPLVSPLSTAIDFSRAWLKTQGDIGQLTERTFNELLRAVQQANEKAEGLQNNNDALRENMQELNSRYSDLQVELSRVNLAHDELSERLHESNRSVQIMESISSDNERLREELKRLSVGKNLLLLEREENHDKGSNA